MAKFNSTTFTNLFLTVAILIGLAVMPFDGACAKMRSTDGSLRHQSERRVMDVSAEDVDRASIAPGVAKTFGRGEIPSNGKGKGKGKGSNKKSKKDDDKNGKSNKADSNKRSNGDDDDDDDDDSNKGKGNNKKSKKETKPKMSKKSKAPARR
jgi:hypothetical protein